MQNSSDEKLMKSYAGGNAQAFDVLYERHRAPLYRYLLRLAGDPATANDLYQGSWEKVIKGRKTYRSNIPFRAWLYRIAHNHAIDHFRKTRGDTQEIPDDLPSEQSQPPDQVDGDARRRAVLNAIQSLPVDQRDVLILKLESGLDLNTIAEVTGVNPETAKSRLRYAVGKLKRILSPPDHGAEAS